MNINVLLVPATTVLVEVIKKTDFVLPRYLPLVSLGIGVGLGYLTGASLLEGILVGGSAVGLYEAGKNLLSE